VGKYLDMLGDCGASGNCGMENKAFPQPDVQVMTKDRGHALPADALASAAPMMPLSTGCHPVYWESMDEAIIGPGQVLSVTQEGTECWLCLSLDYHLYWIRDGLLRSRQDFEAQNRWTCSCCHGGDYWTSPYRSHICRTCHPPAAPEGEKERGSL
jgi:hypothetical protein